MTAWSGASVPVKAFPSPVPLLATSTTSGPGNPSPAIGTGSAEKFTATRRSSPSSSLRR